MLRITFSLNSEIHSIMKMPTEIDSESEQSAPELIEDDGNRISDDEDFPISDDEEMVEGTEMKGWASSMAKVLKSEKSAVLSKAKKVEDLEKKKEKKSYEFEIDGEVSKKDDDMKPDQTALERALEKRKYRERREVSWTVNIRSMFLILCLRL